MKTKNLLIPVIGGALGAANPVPAPVSGPDSANSTTMVDARTIEPRVIPAAMIAFGWWLGEALAGEAVGAGAGALIEHWSGDADPVDLSAEALDEIKNIVNDALTSSWLQRDKDDTLAWLAAVGHYRAGYLYPTDAGGIADSYEAVTTLFTEGNRILQHLRNTNYGSYAAPPRVQILVARQLLWNEILRLEGLHDRQPDLTGQPHLPGALVEMRADATAMYDEFRVVEGLVEPYVMRVAWRDHESVDDVYGGSGNTCHLAFCRTFYFNWYWHIRDFTAEGNPEYLCGQNDCYCHAGTSQPKGKCAGRGDKNTCNGKTKPLEVDNYYGPGGTSRNGCRTLAWDINKDVFIAGGWDDVVAAAKDKTVEGYKPRWLDFDNSVLTLAYFDSLETKPCPHATDIFTAIETCSPGTSPAAAIKTINDLVTEHDTVTYYGLRQAIKAGTVSVSDDVECILQHYLVAPPEQAVGSLCTDFAARKAALAGL